MGFNYRDQSNQVTAFQREIQNNQKAMEKANLQSQCICTHRNQNGEFALIIPKENGKRSPYTGALLYQCRICHRDIDISIIPEDEFNKSISVINSICDVGKMHMNQKDERDQELFTRVSKFQFKLNTMMKDLYRSVVKNGGRQKKKRNTNTVFEVGR